MFCSCTDGSHCLAAPHPRSNHYKLHQDRKRKEQERFNSPIMTLFISPARGRVFQGASRTGPSQAAQNSPPSSSLPAVRHQKSAPGHASPAVPEPDPRLGSPVRWQGGAVALAGARGHRIRAARSPVSSTAEAPAIARAGSGGHGTTPLSSQPHQQGSASGTFIFLPPLFHSLIGLFSRGCHATVQGPALASARGASSLTKPRSRQGRPALSERHRSSLEAAASPDKERGHAGLLRAQVRSGRRRPLPSSERVFAYRQGSCDGNGWGWRSAWHRRGCAGSAASFRS